MRLHLSIFAGFVALAGVAHADSPSANPVNCEKHLESAPGAASSRPAKTRALFQTQAQLFVEQKEAPTASKTALRLESAPRPSTKSKD